LPDRRQYVEITPNASGLTLPDVMMPGTFADQLRTRYDFANAGVETVNGREATKYVLHERRATNTAAGTVTTDSVLYVDKASGLPLVTRLKTASSSDAGVQVAIEMRDIRRAPEPSLFEVPSGYTLLTAEQARDELREFTASLGVLAALARGSLSTMAK
jgi:hypothetical protein